MKMKKCLPMLFLFAATILSAAVNQEMIQKVADKSISQAHASWWGFDPENATKCLQEAIDSGAQKVIIDNTGSTWYVDPIRLAGNQELVIGENVTVSARPGGFLGPNDCLFTAEKIQNLTIRGEKNAVLTMNKSDYQDKTRYKSAEWRHALALFSVENVTIKDLAITNSGGDGIYVGRSNSSDVAYSKDIVVENVQLLGHHRQGISVITVENLLLKKINASNTSGTLPQSGIDFEPNAANERLINCVVEDSTFNNNAGFGIEFFLVHLTEASKPISITIKNCTIQGNQCGIILRRRLAATPGVRGQVEFQNCQISKSQNGNVGLWDPSPNFQVKFSDCKIDCRGMKVSNAISIAGDNSLKEPVGNVIFHNTAILSSEAIKPINLVVTPATLLNNDITGTLSVNGVAYDLKSFMAKSVADHSGMLTLRPAELTDFTSLKAQPNAQSSNNQGSIPFRKPLTLLLMGEPGKTVDYTLSLAKLGANTSKGKVTVKAPDGTIVNEFMIEPDSSPRHHSIKTDASGIYQVELSPYNQMMWISSKSPAQGLLMDKKYAVCKPNGKLFFQVPAGVKEFSVVVAGEAGELLDCALLDPSGKTIQSVKRFDKPITFRGKRNNASTSEIYSIYLNNATEDVTITLMAPLLPIMSQSPQNLLIQDKGAINILDVKNFGITGINVAGDTAAFNAAMSAVEQAGGGVVRVPAGRYRLGTVKLVSNLELILEKDAFLEGSGDINDYALDNTVLYKRSTRYLFSGINVKNVKITGQGTISGNGRVFWHDNYISDSMTPREDNLVNYDVFRPKALRPEAVIYFSNSENIRISGINIIEAATYTVWCVGSNNIEITDLTVKNDRRGPNTDVLDIDCCSNVTIDGCNFSAGDDCIAIKSDPNRTGKRQATENITVKNSILSSATCAIRIGYEGDEPIRNCSFENLTINNSRHGIDILSITPNTPLFKIERGSPIENLVFKNIVMNRVAQPFFIWAGNESPRTEYAGYIRNIRFADIKATAVAGSFIGSNVEGAISDIDFTNVKIHVVDAKIEMDYDGDRFPGQWGGSFHSGAVMRLKNVRNLTQNQFALTSDRPGDVPLKNN